MTSEFDSFIGAAFGDALKVFGLTTFTIDGIPGVFECDAPNLQDGEASLDMGGFNAATTGTVVAQIAQFQGRVNAPLPTELEGNIVTIDGRRLRIGHVFEDAISLTLYLENPTKPK